MTSIQNKSEYQHKKSVTLRPNKSASSFDEKLIYHEED